jgi:hypothetical protein
MADDLKDKAADLVRKVLTVGVGAAFLTEESLRGLVSEFKLPKELLGGILESANKSKNEFFQNLSRDLINRLTDGVDPKALLTEIIETHEVEFRVKVRFKPKAKPASGHKR